MVDSYIIFTFILAAVVAALIPTLVLAKKSSKTHDLTEKSRKDNKNSHENVFKVKAVSPDFNWEQEKPLRSYPFKDKEYKLTMGIRTIDIGEWLLLENTYLNRIEEKTKIITNTHPGYDSKKDLERSTVFTSPEGDAAAREFYDVVITYMCEKYPHYFYEKEGQVFNAITKEFVPKYSSSSCETRDLLKHLTRTIEEDFIILLKDPSREGQKYGDEYYFKAGVFAFAAGFDPIDKFDQPLTLIHGPIPGYEEKLKLSMNRFFNKLQPGTLVSRANFSIQTHPKFYVDDENKGYHLTEEELNKPIPFESLDFEKQVHYRSERQVLIKLPKSQATVFTIRTYLHPMSDFAEDIETAQRLRGNLEKFPDEMARYKNITQPRPAVMQYIDSLQG